MALAAAADDPYDDAQSWLCLPNRNDACAADLTTAVIARDGSVSIAKSVADPTAAIDCFYVYPTVSTDPHGNSSLYVGVAEQHVATQQFARFATVCRPFAPAYRQVTVAGLASSLHGGDNNGDRELAYDDVLAAWRHYLAHDNQGRGVVLIGHSQGSRLLIRLIQEEIDGKPLQKQLVSAILLGMNVEVPHGAVVGGSFKKVPLCQAAREIGCVISYESFRAARPPAAGTSRFGHSVTTGMDVACTDPTVLSEEAPRAYFPARASLMIKPDIKDDWQKMVASVQAPFVSLPGMIELQCKTKLGYTSLAVSIDHPADDTRAADIPGDLVIFGKLIEGWGMHLVDMNLAQGNLVDIVRAQSATYAAPRP